MRQPASKRAEISTVCSVLTGKFNKITVKNETFKVVKSSDNF